MMSREEQCDAVDAIFFSSDALYFDADRAMLKQYLSRWNKAVVESEDAPAMTKHEVLTDDEFDAWFGGLGNKPHHGRWDDREFALSGWHAAKQAIIDKLTADVELPPLPERKMGHPSLCKFDSSEMETYARQAIAADRARRGGQELSGCACRWDKD